MPERQLRGVAASPGVAAGRAVVFAVLDAAPAEEVPPRHRAAQALLATDALEAAAAELEDLARRLAADDLHADAEIVETSALMARDPGLIDAVERAVDEGQPAVNALVGACEAQASLLASLPDELLAARASDVRSIGRRAARLASGASTSISGTRGGIAVAEDLGPADVADIQDWAQGIALAAGGPTAHAAIVARSLGVPMACALGPATLDLPQGAALVVDGEKGWLVIDPAPARLAAARAATAQRDAARRIAVESRDLPAVTTDGHQVTVLANVASAVEVRAALQAGAEGVGLLRTELLLLDAAGWPTEAEHRRALQPVLAPLAGRVATVRVLDYGADKLPPFLRDDGARGIALLLRHPDALEDQLAAILAEGAACDLRILLPMVDDASEIDAVSRLLARARARTRARTGVLGAMIETTAAVERVAEIAARCAFLSIGTNDLTAAILGVDRFAAGEARTDDPRVVAAIARTVEAGHAAGIPVEVCGEAAADPALAPLLIGAGVDELSAGAARVGVLRGLIRTLAMEDCQKLLGTDQRDRRVGVTHVAGH
jgi:phosphoenolpyruvate-protein kinase (PTS system EI component)